MDWRDLKIIQTFRRMLGRWLRKKGKITPQTEAKELVLFASGRGYKLMHDPEFRRLTFLDSVDEFEDGRIFNELVAAMLTLLHVYLRSQIPHLSGEHRLFWRSVHEEIVPTYIAWLSELKIRKDFVETWEKLLWKRINEYDDYERDSLEYLRQHPLEKGTPMQREAFTFIMTISSYTMMYLKRGKSHDTDKQAQLLIQRHLVQFQNDLFSYIGWQ